MDDHEFAGAGLSLTEFARLAFPAAWHAWQVCKNGDRNKSQNESYGSKLLRSSPKDLDTAGARLRDLTQALLAAGRYTLVGRLGDQMERRMIHLNGGDCVRVIDWEREYLFVIQDLFWQRLSQVRVYGQNPALVPAFEGVRHQKGRRRSRADAVAAALKELGLADDPGTFSYKVIAGKINARFQFKASAGALEKAVQRHYESRRMLQLG